MEEEEKNDDGEGKEEEAAEGEQEKKRLPLLCCLRMLCRSQMSQNEGIKIKEGKTCSALYNRS